MSFRFWFLLVATAFAWPATSLAQSIACADFNANIQKLDSNWTEAKTIPAMELNLGFVMGAYFIASGQPLEKFKEADFSIFLQKVMGVCSEAPKKHVMSVTLEVAKEYGGKLGAAATDQNQIDLIDLKLDVAKMSGKSVTVHGTITILGDMAMLGEGSFDSTPIPVSLSRLSRDDRKALLENCEMQCGLTIKGKVGDVMMQKGVIAESIALD